MGAGHLDEELPISKPTRLGGDDKWPSVNLESKPDDTRHHFPQRSHHVNACCDEKTRKDIPTCDEQPATGTPLTEARDQGTDVICHDLADICSRRHKAGKIFKGAAVYHGERVVSPARRDARDEGLPCAAVLP